MTLKKEKDFFFLNKLLGYFELEFQLILPHHLFVYLCSCLLLKIGPL